MKLLEENIDLSLCSLELGNGFLGVTPEVQAAKGEIDHWASSKLTIFVPQ